jgi:hypothetical protein
MRPARRAAKAHVVDHLAAASMHQDDRQRVALLHGLHVLHEHRRHVNGAVWHLLRVGRAHPEHAGVGQLQRERIVAGSPYRGRLIVGAGHVLVHPVDERLQHLAAVLLHHHGVAIAVHPECAPAQLLGLHARLLQKRDGAWAAGRRK